jgi:transketolase
MVGVATGLACRKKIPFCSTFATFFIRAADQIRIAGISASKIKMVGSHSGCSIGEDGPSQMALEDLAFFRTIPKGIVLIPSDGVSTEKAVELVANYNEGPAFIRTARPDV